MENSTSNTESSSTLINGFSNEVTPVTPAPAIKHDGGVNGAERWPTQMNGAPFSFYPPVPTPSQNTLPPAYNPTEPSTSQAIAAFNYPIVHQPVAPVPSAPAQSSVTRGKPNISRSAYRAPTFVPATSLSQPYDPAVSLGTHRRELPVEHNGADAYSNDHSAKNNLKRSYPTYEVPTRTERALTPTKKWKSIVKAEPMSPVLSFAQPIEPIPDSLGGKFHLFLYM